MAERIDSSNTTWVLVVASVANLMVALDAMVVTTALARIGRELGVSIEALEWTINAYTLSFAAFFLLAAALGDRYGRRRMFIAGLLLFVAASAACALAPSIAWLIAARAVQGIGAAVVMPLALAQISVAFPPERRAWALGVYSSVAGLSTVLGPTIGGIITEGLAWRWTFWMNLPLGLAVAGFAAARLRETFGARTPIVRGGHRGRRLRPRRRLGDPFGVQPRVRLRYGRRRHPLSRWRSVAAVLAERSRPGAPRAGRSHVAQSR